MKSLILHQEEVNTLSETGTVTVIRPVKPQPGDGCNLVEYQPESKTPWWITSDPGHFSLYEYSCPFGHPGEVRFVKETWHWHQTDLTGGHVCFKDGNGCPVLSSSTWRSSSTMPQWASRFNVECVSVEVVKQLCADIWDWKIKYKKVG
jgi:hypothetical protein